MWDLPRPGIEPMSPVALQGGFLTTGLPGEPLKYSLHEGAWHHVGVKFYSVPILQKGKQAQKEEVTWPCSESRAGAHTAL